MPDDFLIARNDEESTSLPYLVRIPLGVDGIVLKVRETWPRTSKVYCQRAEWPADPEIMEQIRGAARDGARRSTWCWTGGGRTAPSSCSPSPEAGR